MSLDNQITETFVKRIVSDLERLDVTFDSFRYDALKSGVALAVAAGFHKGYGDALRKLTDDMKRETWIAGLAKWKDQLTKVDP